MTLKSIVGKIKQYYLYSFDIETYSTENLFLMGSIYSLNGAKVFYNKDQMIKELLSIPEKNNAVFATNLQFDILALFENTEQFNRLKFIVRDSEIISVKIEGVNKFDIYFLDTMNFARFSVKELGKLVNETKLNKPKCLGDIPKTKSDFEELEKYNIQDSKITYLFSEFLQKTFNDLNAEMKMTIASTSMNLFRRNYLNYDIEQPPRDILDKFYLGYYGGRTEIFKRGTIKNLFYYDFNSLYPAQYHKVYPNPNYIKIVKNPRKDLFNKCINHEGLSLVDVEINKNILPFLPYRDIKRNKLLFPLGKFTGWYSNVELRKAKKLGYQITKCYEMIYYTQTFEIFKKFGEDLYSLRMKYKENKSSFELPLKIILNSLYGKFAQKYYYTELINISEFTFEQIKSLLNSAGELKDISIVKNFAYVTNYDAEPSKFINPIISIYITSYARIQLYDMMVKCKNLYYCDTDSIITDEKLECSKYLGALKLEHTIKEGILVKPKLYGFINSEDKHIIRAKGIPIFYDEKIKNKYKQFKEILLNPEINYIKFTKFKESLRSKTENKRGLLKFNEKQNIKKILDLEDNKRLWQKEFNMQELQESKPIILK